MCVDVNPESTEAVASTKFGPDHIPSLDWSNNRRNEVIFQAWKELDGRVLSKKQDLSDADRSNLGLLWYQIIAAFQNGASLLLKNDSSLSEIKFEKNILPTHSEYHIAKVLTIVAQLIEGFERSGKIMSSEDKLALILAVLIHDLGTLKKEGDSREANFDQTQLYEEHELRAIQLAEPIIQSLGLDPQGINISRLIAKVKLLIAGTIVDLNISFGKEAMFEQTQINSLLENGADAQLTSFGGVPSPYLEEVKKEFQTNILSDEEKKSFQEMLFLMATADHGAYLLEPCRLGEINGLWRELQRLRINQQEGTITHRPLPTGLTVAHEYFTSTFPTAQSALYRKKLQEFIPQNPFDQLVATETTVNQAITQVEQLTKSKPEHDPVSRFEGFFSPAQLLNLLERLEIRSVLKGYSRASIEPILKYADTHQSLDVANIPEELISIFKNLDPTQKNEIAEIIGGKIITRLNEKNKGILKELELFSNMYSTQNFEAGQFNMLATGVLREIYKGYNSQELQEQFFYESLDMMTKQAAHELDPEKGTTNIHIAPFVYLPHTDRGNGEDILRVFTHTINSAYEQLPIDQQKRIQAITFTWRQQGMDRQALDSEEQFNRLVAISKEFNLLHTLRSHAEPAGNTQYHPLSWEVSIAGRPPADNSNLKNLLGLAREKKVPALVHFGLEDGEESMRQRIEAILEQDIKESDPLISIHIDNHFDWFVRFYDSLVENKADGKSEIKRARLENLIKSADPLGYLLTSGNEAHYWVAEFFRRFKNTAVATNNCSNTTGSGITVHKMAVDLIRAHISTPPPL